MSIYNLNFEVLPEDNLENTIDFIYNQLNNGFNVGYHPDYILSKIDEDGIYKDMGNRFNIKFNVETYEEPVEVLRYIFNMINEGYIEGFDPFWRLTYDEDEDVIYDTPLEILMMGSK